MLLKKRAVRLALVVATVNYLRLLTNIAKVVRLKKSFLFLWFCVDQPKSFVFIIDVHFAFRQKTM